MAHLDYPEIQALRTHLVTTWGAAHGKWQEWHDFFDQRHRIRYARPADVRKLGLARAKISTMVDTLVTTEPIVERFPVAPGQVHEERADAAEKWAKALLAKAAVAGGAIPPFRTAALYLALLGYTVGVVRWDDALWEKDLKVPKGPGYQKRQKAAQRDQQRRFPFVIEFPHPARVLLPHQERRPSFAIELASMYGYQVEKLLAGTAPGRLSDLHAKSYDILEVVSYWDEEHRQLFVGSEEADYAENGLGMVPFVHAFAGYGFEGMPAVGSWGAGSGAVPSLGPKPEDLAVGRLAGATDAIKALDEFTTAIGFLVQSAAYPTYFTKENAEELQRQREQAGLGGVVQVGDPANALRPAETAQIMPGMFEHEAALRRAVDELTFHGVVQGELSPNVRTATGLALQLGQARLGFGMPMTQLNLLAGEILGICARMTSLRGEHVRIEETTCGAEEFEGNYDFTVDFMAKDEGQRLRDTAAANAGFQLGTESFEGVQTAKGISDVTGKRREVTIDKARAMPVYMETIMAAAEELFKERLAQKGVKPAGSNGAAPTPTPPQAPVPGGPQPFMSVPGGPQQAQQVQQGMEATPGAGIMRVIPGA